MAETKMGPSRQKRSWLVYLVAAAGLIAIPLGLWFPPHQRTRDLAPDGLAALRQRMVDEQIRDRGVRDERVLKAMTRVARHEFVMMEHRHSAYDDRPLPIGHGQTISQPYIVGFMTEALRPQPSDRVLEVGTGSGYQAAILAGLVKEVYTIELIPDLGRSAEARLKKLEYKNVKVRVGDGYLGWPEAGPFDSIIVTCGADHVPKPLVDQLKSGGRMIIPVSDKQGQEWLRIIEKDAAGRTVERDLLPVRFVPLQRAGDQSKGKQVP